MMLHKLSSHYTGVTSPAPGHTPEIDFEDNNIISMLFDRKRHISYDITEKNSNRLNQVDQMIKRMDHEKK